ncbi:MAG TPA: tRNA (guanosine(37)-N1)-methyltransferase TrmD [Ferrovibrio sp.]|uniref:tRNA (guanosine(37)-N1)-methyltransferase TrmD n=1 Tax=Ferrovibrio sp. TaxID=1917215 RepID=UPI002B4AB6A1|nr:tRNA (guanosine(37)-N1)-methyltransferase TrmD [Ferrovibrio sp.]HLT76599.1 tRNA (guanosine(37)-N1)-methyltransferase TrmD [Ferrovibrio sp.]
MTGTGSRGWDARILTLYPAMFPGPLGQSLAGRALNEGVWSLRVVDIRDFARDKHRSVDDTPFGGGPGMVMRPDVLAAAIDATVAAAGEAAAEQPLIYFSPRGRRLDQALVHSVKDAGGATLVCGRFEGVDERLLQARPVTEVSLGDFVLSGGEIAAYALLDAVVRLLPGVMGAEESGTEESFADGLLEYPQYTRPQEWEGRSVPEVLLSGHHERIAAWRRDQAERITAERRPDLWEDYAKRKRGK